jgi:hypothetical protein
MLLKDNDLQIGKDEKRDAFRVPVPELSVELHGSGQRYSVKNLSAVGVALLDGATAFELGQEVVLDFHLAATPVVAEVRAEVSRLDAGSGLAALHFKGLDRRRQSLLDKLILEVQKRIISLRKVGEIDSLDDGNLS